MFGGNQFQLFQKYIISVVVVIIIVIITTITIIIVIMMMILELPSFSMRSSELIEF